VCKVNISRTVSNKYNGCKVMLTRRCKTEVAIFFSTFLYFLFLLSLVSLMYKKNLKIKQNENNVTAA